MFTMLPASLKTASGPPPVGNYVTAVLALSPISYYRLGEASGTAAADLGSRAQTGTYAGTFTLNQASLLPSGEGKSVAKTGTGRVTFPVTTKNKPFSMAMWIKRTSSPANTQVLLALGASGGAQLALDPSFKLIGGASGNFNLSAGTSAIALNTNTFVVWTIDASGNYKYYINGSLDFSGTNTGVYGSTSTVGTIGIYTDSTGFPFTGNMQEVAVFGAELTAAQITALYAAAQP